MRVRDMPTTADGQLDINFIRTQPIFNQEFKNSKEKFVVEIWANMNSRINSLANQVPESLLPFYVLF